MPRNPVDQPDELIALYQTILSASRQVRAAFSQEQAEGSSGEKPRSAELDRYRQHLGVGLDRLRGKFQETLGESQDD